MNRESSTSIYFISVASTLSGIHQQTIRSYEDKGLIKPYRTGGGTRRYSQNDIDKVLSLEQRHFGALAGQGLVNIKLKNYEKAIESYEKAQDIYPAMQSPKIMIKQIRELIKKELI